LFDPDFAARIAVTLRGSPVRSSRLAWFTQGKSRMR